MDVSLLFLFLSKLCAKRWTFNALQCGKCTVYFLSIVPLKSEQYGHGSNLQPKQLTFGCALRGNATLGSICEQKETKFSWRRHNKHTAWSNKLNSSRPGTSNWLIRVYATGASVMTSGLVYPAWRRQPGPRANPLSLSRRECRLAGFERFKYVNLLHFPSQQSRQSQWAVWVHRGRAQFCRRCTFWRAQGPLFCMAERARVALFSATKPLCKLQTIPPSVSFSRFFSVNLIHRSERPTMAFRETGRARRGARRGDKWHRI